MHMKDRQGVLYLPQAKASELMQMKGKGSVLFLPQALCVKFSFDALTLHFFNMRGKRGVLYLPQVRAYNFTHK